MNKNIVTKSTVVALGMSPLIGGNERLRLLKRIRGMWKNRKLAPIRELQKIRREWERDIA